RWARASVSAGRGGVAPRGHAVSVVDAERAARVLGERVAVALAVGGAHECGDDVEVPLVDVGGLAPEIGEAEGDVELEQLDAAGRLRHAAKSRKAVGRHSAPVDHAASEVITASSR